MPDNLRAFKTLKFDPNHYDFRGAVAELFDVELGSDLASALSSYSPEKSPFGYEYAKKLRVKMMRDGQSLLVAYEALVKEIIAPMMLAEYEIEKATFLYQYPPTLRVFPSLSPPKALGRLHTDYEYGHQDGEINFWLPVVNIGGDNASLWSESSPGTKDFFPFSLNYGEIQRFHGVSLMHGTYPNDSGKTRISLDFRVALEESFETGYSHPNRKVNFKHEMKRLPLKAQGRSGSTQGFSSAAK
ncbi:MAG: hypothetical protein P1V97_38310 [Planctomycetota bacterium]|nr:hypothetical protein [Planctomycetota bacterium]